MFAKVPFISWLVKARTSMSEDTRVETEGPFAGSRCVAVDQHGAGAALSEPAAEFGGGEAEAAQDVKQRLVRVGGLDGTRKAVDADVVRGVAATPDHASRNPLR